MLLPLPCVEDVCHLRFSPAAEAELMPNLRKRFFLLRTLLALNWFPTTTRSDFYIPIRANLFVTAAEGNGTIYQNVNFTWWLYL